MPRPRIHILEGRKFGCLSALEHLGRGFYRCSCICGKELRVQAGHLIKARSCGCKKKRDGPRGSRYRLYIRNAQARGHEFKLSEQECLKLFDSPCHYCGGTEPPSRCDLPALNGLDRVNNSEGYHLSNVVPCCRTCNMMKRSMTVAGFLAHAERIAVHRGKNIGNREGSETTPVGQRSPQETGGSTKKKADQI